MGNSTTRCKEKIVGNSLTLLVESRIAQLINVRGYSPIGLVFGGVGGGLKYHFIVPLHIGSACVKQSKMIREPVHFVCVV